MENRREELSRLISENKVDSSIFQCIRVEDKDIEKVIDILKTAATKVELIKWLIQEGIMKYHPIIIPSNYYPTLFISNGDKCGALSIFRGNGIQISGDELGNKDMGSSYGTSTLPEDLRGLDDDKDDYREAVVHIFVAHIIDTLFQANMYEDFYKNLNTISFGDNVINTWFKESLLELEVESIDDEYVENIDLLYLIDNFVHDEASSLEFIELTSNELNYKGDITVKALVFGTQMDIIKEIEGVQTCKYIDTYGSKDKNTLNRISKVAQLLIGVPSDEIMRFEWESYINK